MDENDRQGSLKKVEKILVINEGEQDTSDNPEASSSDSFDQPVAEELLVVPETDVEDTEQIAQSIEGAPPQTSFEENARQNRAAGDAGEEPDTIQTATPAASSTGMTLSKRRRTQLMAAAGVVLLMGAGVTTWALLAGDKSNTNNQTVAEASDTETATSEPARLGVAVTVADGTVEYLRGEADWQAVSTSTELKEGDTIRTAGNSRAVLTLDDGSAVRLNADTIAKLSSLIADKIEIDQIAGMVYSRIVPSERSYIVSLDGTTYKALGTAFVTSRNMSDSGIQVYQGAVETDATNEIIGEGKQLYKPFGDYIGPLEVTDIDLDLLLDDQFVAWNLAEDEKDSNFKEKLGVLAQMKALGEEKAKQEEQKAKAVEEKKLTEKEADKQKQSTPGSGERVSRGDMTLSVNGSTLSWQYSGKAVHGYKLVFSDSIPSPTFGQPGTEALHLHATDSTLPKGKKGTFSVRVCAYTAGTESTPCIDYSNAVTVTVN